MYSFMYASVYPLLLKAVIRDSENANAYKVSKSSDLMVNNLRFSIFFKEMFFT